MAEVWDPAYEDRGSIQFKQFSQRLSEAIETLYKNNTEDDSRVFGNVVNIK